MISQGTQVFSRKIEQLFSFKRTRIDPVKHLINVVSVMGEALTQASNKVFPLLYVSRLRHHHYLIDPHKLFGIFIIELYIAFIRRNEIVTASHESHETNGVEHRSRRQHQTTEQHRKGKI